MELEYGRRIVFFTWTGFDEGDEVCGSGSAELEDDGTVEIELSFHGGDDAILKACRVWLLQQPARLGPWSRYGALMITNMRSA
jgi:hypothetical protein